MPTASPDISEKVTLRCAALSYAGSLDATATDVGTGSAGAGGTGDLVRIQLRAGGDRLVAARFKAFGCTATIACASLACEAVEGGTLEEAEAILPERLAAALDLPLSRLHCATLALVALRDAIRDLRNKVAYAGGCSINPHTGGME